jgi:hypothetical protein
VTAKQGIRRLAGREYLPLVATIALWAVIAAAIGHADAARLLAATIAVRAIQLLTKFTTSLALRRRLEAPKAVRRQAKRFALDLQAGALVLALLLVAVLVEAMKAIGQHQIAAYLPFVAIGMPARYIRFADVRTASPYYRLALACGGLFMALLGWISGWQATLFGLAFGAREWIAYAVLRLWPRAPTYAKIAMTGNLTFAEVARYSAIQGRRLLTYRLTKSALTVFGPLGNVAARTGRGLNWHKKIEPYLPHHLAGFILFSVGTMGAAAFLALGSGEPAAMIAAAGLLQIGAAAANVVLLWRYLPDKPGDLVPEDDDDDE